MQTLCDILLTMPASEILLTIQRDTKAEEEEIIKQFLTRLQYSAINIVTSECPDFEVQIKNDVIGIEVTKYYSDFTKNGSKTQKTISEWKRFAKKLKAKLIRINSKYDFLYGSIHFHKGTNNYQELLSDANFSEFVTLLENNVLNDDEQITVTVSQETYPTLSKRIISILLWNTSLGNKYLWWDSSLQSGEVIKNNKAIDFIIEKKETSSKKYKANYFQKWLIIYAGGTALHDMHLNTSGLSYRQGKVTLSQINDTSQLEQKNYKTEYFSHIFIWDKYTETIYLLYPYHKKIFDYAEKAIYINYLPLKVD